MGRSKKEVEMKGLRRIQMNKAADGRLAWLLI